MKRKILVTGATGFVGTILTKYLSGQGFDVVPLDLRIKPEVDPNNSYYALIHLAGKAHDLKNHSNADEYYSVNRDLTVRLFESFRKSLGCKFIYFSSVKAVADHIDGLLDETHTPSPQTDYGLSKLQAERYIQSHFTSEQKSYYILRPCMIHGPGNKGNLNLLYKFAEKGLPYPLAAFENIRSFLSIDNLCFVLKELLENDIPSGVYNVADDEALSTTEVMGILSTSLGKRPMNWKLNKAFIELLAKIGDNLSLPINSERLSKLTESFVVSNEKLKGAIGKELPVRAREGLLKTALSFGAKKH